jgi:hypothetical protein
LASKQDPDEYDGRDTVLEEPSPNAQGRTGPDLEDNPTELWAPVAQTLFADDGDTPVDPVDAGQPARRPDFAAVSGELTPPEPEEVDTEIMPEGSVIDEIMDTVEVSPEAAAAAIAEAEAEAAMLLSETVEVSGAEGKAARELAAVEQEARRYDPSATMVVDRPRDLPKLSHECRMCGRKITRPIPRRLRGSTSSEHGFRCEKCHNVFCAAHVVRVSGLWESLLGKGRFRCQLCLPKTRT